MNQMVMNLLKQKVLGQLSDADAAEQRRLKRAITEGWTGVGNNARERRSAVGVSEQTFDDLMIPNGRRNRIAIQDSRLRQYAERDEARTAKIAALSYFANSGSTIATARDAQLLIDKDNAGLKATKSVDWPEVNAVIPDEYLKHANDITKQQVLVMYRRVIVALENALVDFTVEGISDDGIMRRVLQAYTSHIAGLNVRMLASLKTAIVVLKETTVPSRFSAYLAGIGQEVPQLIDAEIRKKEAAEKQRVDNEKKAAEEAAARRIKVAELQKTFDVKEGRLDLQPLFWPKPTEAEGLVIVRNIKEAFARAQKVVAGHFPDDYGSEPQYICVRSLNELDWTCISSLRSLLVEDRFGLNEAKGKLGQGRITPEMTLAFFWAMNPDGRAEIGFRDGRHGDFKSVARNFPELYARFTGDEGWIRKQTRDRLSRYLGDQTALGAASRWALNNAQT
ncbi:hypothetical protein [Rhizobium sp. BK176]|uniref:hypothetical protein n=1 Tax=Rhizobium sp. BK176 TaxID=2587071 RepID=UPI00216A0FA0|nr:hypothetical protein [Rhizobium sp. BK176]MCS4089238.1 hypothetical protein [Rhizobium sp. BK176]